ncbi:MAG: 30S ribosomal protein S6 [Alphaproteobacteria bacterium]|nr:30S ribosomal protein S6 [Alphaproteobacteria bacterium]
MAIYETVLIARAELTPAQVEKLTKDFADVLVKGKGKILKTEQWGLRTLAYRINKARKAHYALIESECPSEALVEMERQMRINEDVVRYMSLKLEEPTKGQSKVLDKSNDNDRFEEEAA